MGFLVSDWDGVVILKGESFDKILAVCLYEPHLLLWLIQSQVFESEEYQRKARPDEDNFLDRGKCQMLPVGIVTII